MWQQRAMRLRLCWSLAVVIKSMIFFELEQLHLSARLQLLGYELNRQRNVGINECNCRGIAVMCV